MSTFGPFDARVVNIHDGDTISVDLVVTPRGKLTKRSKTIDIDLGFGLHATPRGIELPAQPVRIYGDNAAELVTPAGKDALAFLNTLLKVGDIVKVLSHGWDKYAPRIDGQVTLPDGRDLAQTMIDAGYAKPWDGKGPKPV